MSTLESICINQCCTTVRCTWLSWFVIVAHVSTNAAGRPLGPACCVKLRIFSWHPKTFVAYKIYARSRKNYFLGNERSARRSNGGTFCALGLFNQSQSHDSISNRNRFLLVSRTSSRGSRAHLNVTRTSGDFCFPWSSFPHMMSVADKSRILGPHDKKDA